MCAFGLQTGEMKLLSEIDGECCGVPRDSSISGTNDNRNPLNHNCFYVYISSPKISNITLRYINIP